MVKLFSSSNIVSFSSNPVLPNFHDLLPISCQNIDQILTKWTQIEIMDLVVTSQNWMKIDYNWPIFEQKWDKNKNNGFGLGPQNLIIKLANFEWKSMKNQWKINENLMKFQVKL